MDKIIENTLRNMSIRAIVLMLAGIPDVSITETIGNTTVTLNKAKLAESCWLIHTAGYAPIEVLNFDDAVATIMRQTDEQIASYQR